MSAYYNEFDPFAAAWLRELIKAGHIAPGDVDDRSIKDVQADDLQGYTQCHFFAGIGVWSHALRSAGWSDERPVWTGSCPCQPFSAAGKGGGFDDARHLWPDFFRLIAECRPDVVLGEQVASKDGLAWLDLVYADLEGADYAVGAVDTCAAGFGAPHIRQRLYWLADAARGGRAERLADDGETRHKLHEPRGCPAGGLADADGRDASAERQQRGGQQRQQPQDGGAGEWLADAQGDGHERRGQLDQSAGRHGAAHGGDDERVGNAIGGGRQSQPSILREHEDRVGEGRRQQVACVQAGGYVLDGTRRPGPTNGLWADADWLLCRDGKWRPACPKPQPLADGSAESMGRVRADQVAQIEEEINAWSVESGIGSREALRDLRCRFETEAQPCWSDGGVPGLHAPPFLLAFLRQLAEQGWRFAERLPVPREEALGASVRVLRNEGAAASTSRQSGLDGQPTGERPDALHLLSSLLARHAHTAWHEAHQAYAETNFVLAHGAAARVGRLRGYGNAIVAPQAQAFVEAVMSCV